jgi:hypothetical protein
MSITRKFPKGMSAGTYNVRYYRVRVGSDGKLSVDSTRYTWGACTQDVEAAIRMLAEDEILYAICLSRPGDGCVAAGSSAGLDAWTAWIKAGVSPAKAYYQIAMACSAARTGYEHAHLALLAKRDAVFADPSGDHVTAEREFETDPASFLANYVMAAAWDAYERIGDAIYDEYCRGELTGVEFERVIVAAELAVEAEREPFYE